MKMPLQIRFTDIDIFGHVNNAIYAEWFDTARFTFIKSLIPGLDPQGKCMVMVHLETNFRKQILFDDRIRIETRVEKVGSRSAGITQRIVNEKTGHVHADSYGILSTYDASKQESFPLPAEWKTLLEGAMEF